MALALYRKYRPVSFDDVIGQEHVTAPLIQALKTDKLNHAYLFSGPRGCGKTSSARILARSLNCVNGPTPTPCGECESCQALATNGAGSLDVIEIDAASHGGVDDARELRERAFFAPVSSRFKIYVIDEAHMVSSAGFNALLKLVEEPPDFVKFVFATTEPDKVLQTIRSRTHHYPFRLVPPSVLRAHLEQVCAAESVQVEATVYPLLVRASGGSVRDSLSILDQLLSGADEQGVTYKNAVALLGVTDVALIDETCDALAAADGAEVFAVIDRMVEAGHDPRRFAADLLERLRDLLILSNVPEAASKGLIDAPEDQLARMTAQTLRLGTASLARMAEVLHDGLVQMRGTNSTRLLLELTCAHMLLPAGEEGQAALLQRVERLERRFDITEASSAESAASPVATSSSPSPVSVSQPQGVAVSEPDARVKPSPIAPAVVSPAGPSAAPPVVPASPPAASPEAALLPDASHAPVETGPTPEPAPVGDPELVSTPNSDGVGIADVRRLWPELMERLKQRRLVWSLMQNATPSAVEDGELVLTVLHQGLVLRLSDDSVTTMVRDALHDLLGVDWQISTRPGEQQPSLASAPAEPTEPAALEPFEETVESGAGLSSASGEAASSSATPSAQTIAPSQPAAQAEPASEVEPLAMSQLATSSPALSPTSSGAASRAPEDRSVGGEAEAAAALAVLRRTLGAEKVSES